MNERSSKYSTRSRKTGVTLIEVVAALALMASLLVAILLAKSRHTRQWTRADRRLQAVAAADALLSKWWQDPQSFPRSSTGTPDETPWFSWRTHVITNDAVARLEAQVVRLEIFDAAGSETSPRGTPAGAIIAVDVVLPAEAELDDD